MLTSAQKILRHAYERLTVYDYYEAKKCFYKSINKNETVARYGLSELYYRSANPFHNNDSANQQIMQSEFAFRMLTPKMQQKALAFGINDSSIIKQKEKISLQAFQYAMSQDQIHSYKYFIEQYPYAVNLTLDANKRMHQLAFNQASEIHHSSAYKSFIDNYPEAEEVSRAKALYEELLFSELTFSATLESYQNYLAHYPDGSFVDVAEDSIYAKQTVDSNTSGLHHFIQQNPKNRNVPVAWRRLYKLYMTDLSSQKFDAFKKQFPDYPFMDELKIDQQLSETLLLPYAENNKWGYINEMGNWIIEAQYESVDIFSEGNAIVELDDKKYFINKKGIPISNSKYEDAEAFESGFALVMINDLWGMIDRTGREVLPCRYEDLRYMSDGRMLFMENEKYGYKDDEFNTIIAAQFEEAYDFENGIAVVLKENGFGLIDRIGNELIEAQYEQLITTPYPIVFALLNEEWFVLDKYGQSLFHTPFDAIGLYSCGRAIVIRNGKYGYINEKGQLEIPLVFDAKTETITLSAFENDVAIVQQKNKKGVIDVYGQKLYPCMFDDVLAYDTLLMPVKKGNKWGYVDRNNKIKIDYKFDYAFRFQNNSAWIKMNNQFYLINTQGKTISKAFEAVALQENKFHVVKDNGTYRLIDSFGKMLVPIGFDSFLKINNSYLQLKKENKLVYFNYQSGKFVPHLSEGF